MKRYKRRAERRLVRKSRKVIDQLPWREAVNVLTVALGRAIWQEGGGRDDALATLDIMHTAISECLNAWYDIEDRNTSLNVTPFKRKKSYLREVT